MPSRRTTTSQRTVICFVRHGTTPTTGKVLPGRAKGLHLAEQGIEEARRTGERLAALGTVQTVYSSPLERAHETASLIAQCLHGSLHIERGLIECDFGEWTGADLAVLRKLPEWQTVLHHPSGFRFPDGESFGEMRSRITQAIDRLVARHRGEVIVAVSHADPIKIAVGDAMGVPLDLLQRTVISPASVSVVVYGDEAPSVLAVNCAFDLSSLGIGKAKKAAKDAAKTSVKKMKKK